MDFRGKVWKRVWEITFYGLKSGQDLKNGAAHSHQEFLGEPPRDDSHLSLWINIMKAMSIKFSF